MTSTAITRTILVSALLCSGAYGCRDVGVVGVGSECAEACEADERCVRGACMSLDDGVAGGDDHEEEEDEEEHEEEEASESPRE